MYFEVIVMPNIQYNDKSMAYNTL